MQRQSCSLVTFYCFVKYIYCLQGFELQRPSVFLYTIKPAERITSVKWLHLWSNSTNHVKLYNHTITSSVIIFEIKVCHSSDYFNIQCVEYTGFMKPRIMLTLYTLISLIPLLLMSPQRVRTRTHAYTRVHTRTHAYARVHSCTHVYTREHYYYYGLHWVTTGKETVVHEYKIK